MIEAWVNFGMMRKNVLVTGANGFIGAALCEHLESIGVRVKASIRDRSKDLHNNRSYVEVGDINSSTNWRNALTGVDAVVHAAARVHVMHESSVNPLEEFRRVNVAGSVNLATQAAEIGIKRFVFISSLGVNGAFTKQKPFFADDDPAPNSPYAQSKLEAEKALFRLGHETGMEIVVLRPPMVYGINAPGNFKTLIHWIHKNIPLPLGAITNNRRSFICLDNLVDLIGICLMHERAAGEIFLASDDEDLSTTDLLRRIGLGLGKKVALLPVPVPLLKIAAHLVGRADMAQKLLESLQVDIQKNREILGWRPPFTVNEGLKKLTATFT